VKKRGVCLGLRTKLVASYVALSVTITFASIIAGQYVHSRADDLRGRHAAVTRGIGEIATLAGSAYEEGFSFVLAGDPEERTFAADKLAIAETGARELRGASLSDGESVALDRVIAALAVLRLASTAMFDDFERDHAVARYRYETYDGAIDGASQAIASLDRAAVEESARGHESIRRTSDLLNAAIGLLAIAGAILGGLLIGGRIAKPLVALRDATIAFGAGRLDISVAHKSSDEVGELASAFEKMALATRQHIAQLASAQKLEALGLVAGSVAHDFNNVLGAVLTFSDLALEDLGDGHPVSADLRNIAEAAHRGAKLTQQLLAFSRPRAASLRALSVNEAVESIEPMLARLAGVGIPVHLMLDQSAPLARVDATQLDQVLMNLVVNARDASRQGGAVEICTSRAELGASATLATGKLEAGSYVLVEVRDHGTGMDDETMTKVFEPFFTTKAVGKGTGLGLATVARVAREAGGAVAVESAPGRGTTFRVYLPLAKPCTSPPDLRIQVRTDTKLAAQSTEASSRQGIAASTRTALIVG
jgi:signal transduction histidine kinase